MIILIKILGISIYESTYVFEVINLNLSHVCKFRISTKMIRVPKLPNNNENLNNKEHYIIVNNPKIERLISNANTLFLGEELLRSKIIKKYKI